MSNIETDGVKIKQRNVNPGLTTLPVLATEACPAYLCTMEIEATFICVYCLQVNEVIVDGTGGMRQQYIEDCQVCCRPNSLTITVNEEMQEASIDAEAS